MTMFVDIAKKCSEVEGEADERRLYTIGRWHMSLGWLCTHIIELEDAQGYMVVEDSAKVETVYQLRDIIMGASIILRSLGVDDPASAFTAEYELAAAKHPGMTLDSDKHTDESRYYALAEEVGEVCAALTYDNEAATGHNANLVNEVIQVGGLALAWLMRYEEE